MARTSDRVSSIAAKYARLNPDMLLSLTATQALREQTAKDIRALAASCLRQDEVKGVRKFLKRAFG